MYGNMKHSKQITLSTKTSNVGLIDNGIPNNARTNRIEDRDLISFSERKKHKRYESIKYSTIWGKK